MHAQLFIVKALSACAEGYSSQFVCLCVCYIHTQQFYFTLSRFLKTRLLALLQSTTYHHLGQPSQIAIPQHYVGVCVLLLDASLLSPLYSFNVCSCVGYVFYEFQLAASWLSSIVTQMSTLRVSTSVLFTSLKPLKQWLNFLLLAQACNLLPTKLRMAQTPKLRGDQ